VAKILEDVTVKLLGNVDGSLSEHFKTAYYVLLEESFEPYYCDVD
jgi:hypothetical protein